MLATRPGGVLGLPPGPAVGSSSQYRRLKPLSFIFQQALPLENPHCSPSPVPAFNSLLLSLLIFLRRVSSVRSEGWQLLASLHHRCPVLARSRMTRTWEEAERSLYIPLRPWSNGRYGVSFCQTGAAKQLSFPVAPPEVIAAPFPSSTIKMCPDKYARPH